MQIIHIKKLNDQQKAAVMRLWNQEYPLQLSYETIADLDPLPGGVTVGRSLLLYQ